MTERRKSIRGATALFFLFCLFFYILHAEECALFLRQALALCAHVILPALFPHLVLSEMALPYLQGIGGKCLPRLLGVRRAALPALLCGALCGAPVGARTVAVLCKAGALPRKEGCAIAAYANHTSPAFVIGGVGIALFGSFRLGVTLYLCELAASLLCLRLALLPTQREKAAACSAVLPPLAHVSLSEAILHASHAMLSIGGTVLFFAPIIGFLSLALGNTALPFHALLEVTNACKSAASAPHGALYAAFSIGFGGLSVAMQSAPFLKEAQLSLSRFLLYKIFGAVATLTLFFLLTRLPLF